VVTAVVGVAALFSSGCVTVPQPVGSSASVVPAAAAVPGVYHVIARGQTLWRVSRIYGVDIDELARVNRISDARSLEVGQKLLIPGKSADSICRIVTDEEFAWPVQGTVIGRFGQPYEAIRLKGIHIAPGRSDQVVASRSGKVVFAHPDFLDLGTTLILDHGDGFLTVYGRTTDVLVKPGDVIARGTPIASVGHAGRNARSFLYFEIRKGHIPRDPFFYLSR